jgi:flagella basal body P-ring formation protein FlgA
MNHPSLKLAALILLTIGFATAADEAIQALDTIQRRVVDFLLAQHDGKAEVRLAPLDPRLRLGNCEEILEVFQPSGRRALGNTTVGVRCPGPQAWTVYVSAKVRAFGEVLVAARYLPRGTNLAASDFRTDRRDLGALPGGYETVPDRLIGKRLLRSLPAGAVIPPQALMTPPLIKQGEKVVILARQNGMEVSSSGIALSDAALGDRIRARNESSRQVIEGRAVAPQRIEVEL